MTQFLLRFQILKSKRFVSQCCFSADLEIEMFSDLDVFFSHHFVLRSADNSTEFNSLLTGMIKRMVYGDPPKCLTLHIKEHGRERCSTFELRIGPLILLYRAKIKSSPMQRIKNPNYQGKWKTPWVDNPGIVTFLRSLHLRAPPTCRTVRVRPQ